jgi:hypothetical protein
MRTTRPRTLTVLRRYGLVAITGSCAGLLLHFGLVGIDALFVEEPVLLDLDNRFFRSAVSFPFLPVLLMEIALTTLTVFLWLRLRRTLHEAHEADLQREQYETTVRTLQRAMTLLAQHIAQQNNQILDQIASRREKGQQTSPSIEAASRRISEILHALSEVSFVTPYVKGPEDKPVDLLQELERRLHTRGQTGAETG